eukprot:COSAG03_NODE_9941_length_683_cov_1.595890_1_plen_73_part_01
MAGVRAIATSEKFWEMQETAGQTRARGLLESAGTSRVLWHGAHFAAHVHLACSRSSTAFAFHRTHFASRPTHP